MVNNSAYEHTQQLCIIAEKSSGRALPSMILFANNSYGIGDSIPIQVFLLVEESSQWP